MTEQEEMLAKHMMQFGALMKQHPLVIAMDSFVDSYEKRTKEQETKDAADEVASILGNAQTVMLE